MPQTNNTLRVVVNCPVRIQNGRMVFRQCRPKLRTEHANTQNSIEFNRKTVGDVLCRLEYNRQLLLITRGDK